MEFFTVLAAESVFEAIDREDLPDEVFDPGSRKPNAEQILFYPLGGGLFKYFPKKFSLNFQFKFVFGGKKPNFSFDLGTVFPPFLLPDGEIFGQNIEKNLRRVCSFKNVHNLVF